MLRSRGKLKLDNTPSEGIDVVPYPLEKVLLCIEGTGDFPCALDVGSLRQEVKSWSELSDIVFGSILSDDKCKLDIDGGNRAGAGRLGRGKRLENCHNQGV